MAEAIWKNYLKTLTASPAKTYRNVIFAITDKDKKAMRAFLDDLNVLVPNMARILIPGKREAHKRFVLELAGEQEYMVIEGLEDYGKIDVYFSHYWDLLPRKLVSPFKLQAHLPHGFESIDSLKIFQFRIDSDIPIDSRMAQFNYKTPGNLIGVIAIINGDSDSHIVHGPANLLKISESVAIVYSRVEKVMGTKNDKLTKALQAAFGVE
jgi:hypothetical protein